MGQALVSGFLKSKVLKADEIRLCDTDQEKLEAYAKSNGCHAFSSAKEAVQGADYVLLAVKPQVLNQTVTSFLPSLSENTVVISIAAGVKIARLRGLINPALDAQLVRSSAIHDIIRKLEDRSRV